MRNGDLRSANGIACRQCNRDCFGGKNSSGSTFPIRRCNVVIGSCHRFEIQRAVVVKIDWRTSMHDKSSTH